jgi:multiple sugar transport system ATP-binding protein
MTLADKIVVLKDGLVQQVGSPMDLYHHPANEFVAGFLGAPSMNFLDVEVVSVGSGKAVVQNAALDAVEVPVRTGVPQAGGRARLGIRPQYLGPAGDAGAGRLHGTVTLTERLGSETVLEVQLPDKTPLIAALTRDVVFAVGAPLDLAFDPAMTHLFA